MQDLTHGHARLGPWTEDRVPRDWVWAEKEAVLTPDKIPLLVLHPTTWTAWEAALWGPVCVLYGGPRKF